MAEYKSKKRRVEMPIADCYARLTDMNSFRALLDQVPEEMRSQIGEFEVGDDYFAIVNPQMGPMTMRMAERKAPELVKFVAENSPIPMSLAVKLKADGDDATKVRAVIDMDVPMMVRAFIGPKLQEAADKFGELLVLILTGGNPAAAIEEDGDED